MKLLAALGAAAMVLALVGCGSSVATHQTQAVAAQTQATQAPDPAALVRQAGAQVTPGSFGDTDVYGDKMATGTFPGSGGEQLTVYTSGSPEALSNLPVFGDSGGSVVIIADGGHAVLELTGVVQLSTNALTFHVSPSAVAARTGGHVAK